MAGAFPQQSPAISQVSGELSSLYVTILQDDRTRSRTSPSTCFDVRPLRLGTTFRVREQARRCTDLRNMQRLETEKASEKRKTGERLREVGKERARRDTTRYRRKRNLCSYGVRGQASSAGRNPSRKMGSSGNLQTSLWAV